AEEFYKQAIAHKKTFSDQAGLAVTYGNLGRLYLDWGYLDKAEESFHEDLRIALSTFDERGEAQMKNHLAQVALARGEEMAAACQLADARRCWRSAAEWSDASIALSEARDWKVTEAFARKDRSLLYLAEGVVESAEQEAGAAESLFRTMNHSEGIAQVAR